MAVDSAYQVFVDLDATALEGGYVYVGQAFDDPETQPVATFWDEGLTIPAAQPLRTSGGYIVRDGAPANVYTGTSTYAVRVRDRAGGLVYYVASLGGSLSANRITFPIPAGPPGKDSTVPGPPGIGGNPDPRIVYPRLIPGWMDAGDNTNLIQDVLDAAGEAGVPLTLVNTARQCRIRQLRLWSNTTIMCPSASAGFLQVANTPGPMFLNKNPTRGLFTNTEEQQYAAIQDSGIRFIGGTYDGNLATHDNIRGTDNNLRNIISMYGVRDLVVRDVSLVNSGCYALHAGLVDGFLFENLRVSVPEASDGGGTGPTGRNGDGPHITGCARDGVIRNITGRAADDLVALTADDGPETGAQGMFANTTFSGPYTGQGAIRRVLIENIRCERSLYGVRLLSKTSRIEDVTIRNVTGTTFGISQITAYREAGGSANGNFGKITIDGFDVQPLDFISGDPAQPGRDSDNRVVAVSAKIEELNLLNMTRRPCAKAAKTHFPLVDFDANAVVDTCRISVTAHDRAGFDQRYEGMIRGRPGALVRTLDITADWQRDADVNQNASLLDWQGGAIGVLRLHHTRANRTKNLVKLRGNGDYSVVQMSEVYSFEAGTYAIDETRYDDPTAPQAQSGVLYVNANFKPEITMHGVEGSLKIVGPNTDSVKVRSMDPEFVTFGATGNVTNKTAGIASVTRTSQGVFRVMFSNAMSVVQVTAAGAATSALIEYATAFRLAAGFVDVSFKNAGNLVDPDVGTVTITRGLGS